MFSCTASASTCSSKKSVASRSNPSRRSPFRSARFGTGGGHLEHREMPDDRAAAARGAARTRHQVDRGERRAREPVEVRAVTRVEAEAAHRLARRASECIRSRRPAAVLVRLDLDQRGLRGAVEPGDRPGVRVGLLELVGRTVDHELAELRRALPRARGSGRAKARRPRLELEEELADPVGVDIRGAGLLLEAPRRKASSISPRSRTAGSRSHAGSTPANPR